MPAERSHAEFRFYEELNDFLLPERRKRDFMIENNDVERGYFVR